MKTLNFRDPALFGSQFDTRAVAWAAQVVTNGGASPANSTIQAYSDFFRGLDADALTAKVYFWNAFAPDNLIAALTPGLKGTGNALWTNTGFVLGDLTVNGLKGNGSSKYLDTGIIPLSQFASADNVGLVLYCSNIPAAESKEDFSVQGVDFQSEFALYFNFNGLAEADSWTFGAQDIITGALPSNTWAGYVCYARLASNSTALYNASNGTAHATLATSSNARTNNFQTATYSMFMFATNPKGAGASSFSAKRFSFAAGTTGLSASDSSKLFNRITTLRNALGGGTAP